MTRSTLDRRSRAVADDRARHAEASAELDAEIARASTCTCVYVRIRSGDSGVLPVVGGLLLISILFQSLNSNFLTAGNLVNLLIQGAVYMLLAMGEVFALLLGEIDLSIGFVSGIGGIITAELVKQSYGWPWWAAILVALVVVRRDRRAAGHDHHPARPSLVRRHARRLARLAGRHAAHPRPGRLAAHQRQRDQRLRQRQPHAGRQLDRHDRDRRRSSGFARGSTSHAGAAAASSRRRASLTILKIVGDGRRRRRRRADLQHQPRPARADQGRAVGRADRARRARGVDVPARPHQVRALRVRRSAATPRPPAAPASTWPRIRTLCFMLASFTAGIAGIVYASRSAVGVDRARRRHARALRGRGGGHRRHEPVRRPRQSRSTPCSAASSSPRSTTAWACRATARPRSTSSPRSCCSPRSRSTPSPAATPPIESADYRVAVRERDGQREHLPRAPPRS